MKYSKQATLLIFILSAFITSCAEKTKAKSSTTYSSSSSSTSSNNGSTDSSGTGTVTGCSDGVYRSGASSCYFTNLPRLVFSGPGTYGPTYWSSNTGLPSYISPSQFRTDSTFAVRIKATYPTANELSRQGAKCSPYLTTNFSKIKVSVMLRRSIDSLGEVKELTSTVNSYSNTARFTVPGGTNDPYILEVIGVNSDHRCKTSIYGKLTTNEQSGCNAGTLFYDIPKNTTNNAYGTECVAFSVEYATDNTYDLPN